MVYFLQLILSTLYCWITTGDLLWTSVGSQANLLIWGSETLTFGAKYRDKLSSLKMWGCFKGSASSDAHGAPIKSLYDEQGGEATAQPFQWVRRLNGWTTSNKSQHPVDVSRWCHAPAPLLRSLQLQMRWIKGVSLISLWDPHWGACTHTRSKNKLWCSTSLSHKQSLFLSSISMAAVTPEDPPHCWPSHAFAMSHSTGGDWDTTSLYAPEKEKQYLTQPRLWSM